MHKANLVTALLACGICTIANAEIDTKSKLSSFEALKPTKGESNFYIPNKTKSINSTLGMVKVYRPTDDVGEESHVSGLYRNFTAVNFILTRGINENVRSFNRFLAPMGAIELSYIVSEPGFSCPENPSINVTHKGLHITSVDSTGGGELGNCIYNFKVSREDLSNGRYEQAVSIYSDMDDILSGNEIGAYDGTLDFTIYENWTPKKIGSANIFLTNNGAMSDPADGGEARLAAFDHMMHITGDREVSRRLHPANFIIYAE